MTAEAWSIIGTGAVLIGVILTGLYRFRKDVRGDMQALGTRVDGFSDLSDRLSRIEGIIQGWLNPLPPRPGKDQEG